MMETNPNKKTKLEFSKWLEQLQQESWQLELLISGLAIFGIWEGKSLLDDFSQNMYLNTSDNVSQYLSIILYFLKISWSIFFINLITHVFVRGLWIGAIGLRYVSGDIDYKIFNYSDRFEKYLERKVGSFDNYIERLEKFSSVIFSFTFLLVFFFMSILALILFFVMLAEISQTMFPDKEWIIMVPCLLLYLLMFLTVFVDFLFFGILKRIKSPRFSRFYFWIYRIAGVLTLSFLYRPLLFNFIDNKYTKRLVILAIPYIAFVNIIFPSIGINTYTYMPSFDVEETYNAEISAASFNYIYYDDLREKQAKRNNDNRDLKINWVTLDTYEYTGQALAKIFFHDSKNEEITFTNQSPKLEPFSNKGLYSIFNSKDRENEAIDSLREMESQEKQFMKKIVRGQEDKLTEKEKSTFGHKLEIYRQKERKDERTLNGEINEEYVNKRINYYRNYLAGILASKKSRITMKVDSVEITAALDCSYFIHPNMGEAGMLCYFPLSPYENGKHQIDISIKHAFGNGRSWYARLNFPFVINRRN